jgi:L-threonylcarbamoyladenylate synthase
MLGPVPRVLTVDPSNVDVDQGRAAIAEAAAVLARGGLVAFPTETVYGLGARGLHADEVAKIFVAKGRPPAHPLILHVEGEEMARGLASSWPERASRLARALWPGPITLVVPRASRVPDVVSGGLGTVGLRAPAHPVALSLLRAAGEPLAAPSANAHTHVSPTTAAHVVRSLGDRVDLVLDGGPCAHGIESTVVDLASDPPRVLRPGAVPLARIAEVVPEIAYDPIALASAPEDDAPRASPGLAAKHYAPQARVVLAEGADGVAAAARVLAGAGFRISVITGSDAAARACEDAGAAFVRPLGAEPDAYARALFAALHEVDERACDAVVVERVPRDPAWWAIADRLRRAEVR